MDALGFWGASKILTRNDMEVSEACRYLSRSPQHTSSNLFEYKVFADAEHMMHGSREDRVLAFEEFLHRIDGISVPKPEVMSFMLGYLASRIAPGTIRHSSVLGQVAHRYPTAVIWYGFCAGFAEGDADMPNGSRRAWCRSSVKCEKGDPRASSAGAGFGCPGLRHWISRIARTLADRWGPS